MFTPRFSRPLLLFAALLGFATCRPAAAQTPTATAVTSLTNPSQAGATVNFIATVSSAATGVAGGVQFYADGTPFGLPQAVASVGNSATTPAVAFTFPALQAGPHTVSAAFTPTLPLLFSASSGSVTQVVRSGTTINPLTATPASPSVFGQPVTFGASVANSFGIATGTIQFQANGSPLGPPVSLDATGSASFSTSSLPFSPSAYNITALYSGDSFNTISLGALAGGYQVNRANTTASTPTASPAAPLFGQSVTLTSTVTVQSPGAGAPGGTVEFFDGATDIGAGVIGSGGRASFTTPGLFAVPHTMTARYNGDSADNNFNPSAPSGGLPLTVAAEPTTTSVTSSLNPSALGQSVTFTITVSGQNGIRPTGQVTLSYPNASGSDTTTGGVSLNGNGQAQISVADIRVGTGQTLTASYGGGGNFAASSGTITQDVSAASTATAVMSSSNPAAVGQPVSFTAVVSTLAPGAGAPTGSVTFTISKPGTTPVTLPGARTGGVNSASYTAGETFTTGGVYSVTAVYSPDTASFSASGGSLSPSQQVTAAATMVTVSASPNPSRFGQPITLSARVLGQSGITPTGSIQFSSGGVTLGSQPLAADSTDATGNTAVASLPGVVLPAGSPQVTASYGGDGTYAPGGSTIAVTVTQAASAVTVSSSSPTSVFGGPVTFTAAVTDATPGSTGTPTGTVTFTDTTTGATLGTGTLLADATTQVSTATLSAGLHVISAAYNGDSDFSGSSGSVSQAVNPAGSTTTVAASPTAPSLNQPVTFTATVTNSGGTGATPTGTVTFSEGTTVLGSGSLSGNGGSATATFATPFAAAGGHTITATYNPSAGNFVSSNGTVTVSVGKSGGPSGTPVTVTSSSTLNGATYSSIYGQPVTFTAVVTGSGSVQPTGGVTFISDGIPLNAVPIMLNGGTAAYTTAPATVTSLPSLSAAPHSITAFYSGDSNYVPGTSGAISQAVSPAATSTTAVSQVNPSVVGGGVNFTVTVTNTSGTGVTPTGSVSLSLDGGMTPFGQAGKLNRISSDQSLNSATATASATFTAPNASDTVTVIYTPADGNFLGSKGQLSQTVFNKPTSGLLLDEDHLYVPGTIQYTNDGITTAQLLKSTDAQALGMSVQNLVPNQAPTVLFNGEAIPAGAVTVDASNTHLTIQVPASFTATAGLAAVQVINGNSNNAGASATVAINPVMALPTYPVTGTRSYRLFSMPYDYNGFSPYDIVQATSLSTSATSGGTSGPVAPVAGGGGFQYDPVNELLTGLARYTQGATDADYLALYHWDPNQLRYLTTVPATGQQADSVPFVLGQAFWAVGGPGAQFLGATRIGTPAGFNPTGIPLQPGWNMVGDPFPIPIDLGSMQVSYQGVALPLYSSTSTPVSAVSQGIVSPIFWSYEQAANGTTNYQLNYNGLKGPGGKNRGVIKPYEGYWFYSYQACTLLVNNTPPASP